MLEDFLKQEINTSKRAMPFEQFMQHCLYHPQYGYYTTKPAILGQAGDFTTAPEISSLYGASIANQIAAVYQSGYDILEFGAGSGKLALDVLTRLKALGALPEHYYILEVSGQLRAKQQQTLAQDQDIFQRCQWLEALPAQPIKGVVLANEVLDAMPVSLFRIADNQQVQQAVVANQDDSLVCQWQSATAELSQAVKQLGPLANGYQSEVNLNIKPWLSAVYQSLSEGMALLIDYGFTRSEYYHPDRDAGTLMCHHQHKAHPDPFVHLGQQDITAHVDFTAVAEAGHDLGFEIAGFTSQAAFLIANGIAELAQQAMDDKALLAANHAMKLLTMPQEMGELFKVMALTKGELPLLQGFSLMDYSHRL